MALYIDEEEVWKCPKHPSKRRRTGICHVCLRERLSSLCPDCANVRPCGCYAAATTSSSSGCSAAESFASGRIGGIGRVSNLIDSEPSFRRSRSLAIPFLRSKPPSSSLENDSPKMTSSSASSFWSRFRSGNKSKRDHRVVLVEQEGAKMNDVNSHNNNEEEAEKRRRMMMRKSRSVAVTTSSGVVDVKSSTTKGKGWYFPSPIKAFRQSISRGIMVHERSPLYRG